MNPKSEEDTGREKEQESGVWLGWFTKGDKKDEQRKLKDKMNLDGRTRKGKKELEWIKRTTMRLLEDREENGMNSEEKIKMEKKKSNKNRLEWTCRMDYYMANNIA